MRISAASIVAALSALALATPAAAQFNITTTVTTTQTLPANSVGTIGSTGVITVSGGNNSVTLSGTSGTSTVNNSGSVLQTGNGRTIRNNTSGTPTLVINNNSGALIRSADGDTIRADVAGSNWTITNSGTIDSKNPSLGGSQAIDLDAVTTGAVFITNNATGQITAFAADAIRPGANATVTNAGTITSTLNPVDTSPSSDGIDTQARSGVNVINSGTISGRHGITGGATIFTIGVTNNSGGVITGVNGSGINIDGVFGTVTADVTNVVGATIQGTVAPLFTNGDGDGIDVDGLLTLKNAGDVLAYGAKGVGSDLGLNHPEAVAIGGGTITNAATGRIVGSSLAADAPNGDPTRVGSGILVDNSSGGDALAATTVTNSGLIEGRTGFGIKIIGTFDDTITNNAGGTIRGGNGEFAIQTGGGNDTVTNLGTIIGTLGNALDLGDGDDTLIVSGGAASIFGAITGGAGTNTFVIDPGAGHTFAYDGAMSMFGSVNVLSGVVSFAGQNTFIGTTRISGGSLRLDGANRLLSGGLGSFGSAIDLNGGLLEFASAGIGQTFNSFSLHNDSILDLDFSSVTFNDLGDVTPGKTLTIIDFLHPALAFRFLGNLTTDSDFLSLIAHTTINGAPASFGFDGIYTTVDAVPEPATLMLVALGLLTLGWRWRSRRGHGVSRATDFRR